MHTMEDANLQKILKDTKPEIVTNVATPGGKKETIGSEVGLLFIKAVERELHINVENSTFVDLGGGVGGPSIALGVGAPESAKLYSVELDKGRTDKAEAWSCQMAKECARKQVGYNQPKFITADFLKDNLDYLWERENLKIFFNNYGGMCFNSGVRVEEQLQPRIEELLDSRVCPGTVVVSLYPMFCSHGNNWETNHKKWDSGWDSGSAAIDWFGDKDGKAITVCKHIKTENGTGNKRLKRACMSN